MDYRNLALLSVIVIFFTLAAACTSAPSANGSTAAEHPSAIPVTITAAPTHGEAPADAVSGKESIAVQLASVQSMNPVFREAYRMFSNMKSTEYVHPPYTDDDAAGIYRFDCLGFVDHVLMNATPDSYKAIGKGANPSIESYSVYFSNLDTATPNALGWTRIARPIELKPGDVCLWLKPSTLDTGHMWIIAGMPSVNPNRAEEVMVRIFDSSVAHSDDSRTGAVYRTGLGSGILGFMTDKQGNPAGLYWAGGESISAGEKDTTIVCGRLNR